MKVDLRELHIPSLRRRLHGCGYTTKACEEGFDVYSADSLVGNVSKYGKFTTHKSKTLFLPVYELDKIKASIQRSFK